MTTELKNRLEDQVNTHVLLPPGLKAELESFRDKLSKFEEKDLTLSFEINPDLSRVRAIVEISPPLRNRRLRRTEEEFKELFELSFRQATVDKFETDSESTRFELIFD